MAETPPWTRHVRSVEGGRLVWYAPAAGERFWRDFWSSRISVARYRELRGGGLGEDRVSRWLSGLMRPDGLYVEAGCGSGDWLVRLSGAGFAIEGYEISRELVDRVREHAPDLKIEAGDVRELPVQDGRYDGYLSFGVAEHDRSGPDAILAEASRVLRSGGFGLFTVPSFGPLRRLRMRGTGSVSAPAAYEFFQYGFRKRDFCTAVRRAGFRIEEVASLGLDRLLEEEWRWYRTHGESRLARGLSHVVVRRLEGIDGHMLAVVARKP